MKTLVIKWQHWAAKFMALTRRERGIIAGAVLLGGGYLIFNFGIDPALLIARNASRTEATAQSDLVQQKSILTVLNAKDFDPDAANRGRLAKARQELSAISQRLASFEANMVPPARMQGFLEGLLARNRNIELLGLKTLPVTRVGAPAAPATGAVAQAAKDAVKDAAAQSDDGIYQHGIEIRLAGSYNDLLNYLAELERMPQRVMWSSVSLTVTKYPRNELVLRVYTLSLDKNWLLV